MAPRRRHGQLLARGLTAALALAVIAWSAVLLRDELLAREAEGRVHANPGMSGAELNRTVELLEDAELLNPGTHWKMVRANVLLLRDRPRALRVAESVLASEPDNLGAWIVVREATKGAHPRRLSEARREIRRLDPRSGQ
jgi:hypothetical protein